MKSVYPIKKQNNLTRYFTKYGYLINKRREI